MKEKPKVLLIRFSSMGDLVHASAAIPPLLRAGFDVSLVTKKAFAPLFENYPGLTIFSYEGSSESVARERFFQWFEAQKFSLVIDLHDSWRSWLWRARLKKSCPVVVARKQRLREWGIFLLRWVNLLSMGAGGRAKRFRAFAEDACAKFGRIALPGDILTKLYMKEEESSAQIPSGDFAVFLPGSAWKGKEWPYFSELAEHFAKKIPVIALGGEKDLVCDSVAARAQKWNPASKSLRGKTSLRESMVIISKAKWIVGNDTGLIHVAEALGKDVAVVEGPTHESLGFSPYRLGSILLGLPLLCRPCSKAGKICWRWGSRKCLNDLSAEMVLHKLRVKGYPC